jgi:two-component system chemotaxis response regulator CheY
MLRILIVDDEVVSRKLLYAIFSRYGRCDFATNGQEAIDAFKSARGEDRPYDLICLDIMMPNVDGLQALKAIRRLEKVMGIGGTETETKVIMTTAVDAPKIVIDAFYLGGATSYVVKPIDPKKILSEVKKLGLNLG